MPLPKEKAWFAAKRYGYGWGLPSRWQGWLVFLGYLAAVIIPSFFLAETNTVFFIVYVVALSLILVAICIWKGEPPKWRWGDKPDEEA